MSTGAGCWFEEKEPGQWVYGLQQWPYGEWPKYDEFGPFASFGDAYTHLFDNHANPGGFTTRSHPNGDGSYEAFCKEAEAEQERLRKGWQK